MKTIAIAAALALLAAGAATGATTPQQAKMKACGDRWSDMKAKKTTGTETYAQFSKTCLAEGPAPATNQQQKMKACGDEWTTMKAKHTTGTQTYAQFSKTCLAKG